MSVTVTAVVASARGVAGASGGAPLAPAARTVHVVRVGETVWTIASGLVGPSGDPRPVVDTIVAMNHLGPAPLQAGAHLILPAG